MTRASLSFTLPLLLACACGEPAAAPADCASALAPIRAGFGAPGPHRLERHTLPNPDWPGQVVSLFTPEGVTQAPLVILAHGNGNGDPEVYSGLIAHVVSRGYALLFSPNQIESQRHADRYAALWSGVEAAVRAHAARLDLTRIGLVGHSYGGGALLWLAHRALVEEGFGGSGAFLFALAPWYALGLDEHPPRELPSHLKALFLVFEEDEVTDHRIAIGERASLPAAVESDYLMLGSERRGGCSLPALHSVPQSSGLGGRDDALDARAVFRLFDALAAYAFTGDRRAGRTALGRGDPAQVSLGSWSDGRPLRPLVWSREPQPARPASGYLFPLEAEAEWRRYGEPNRE